MSWALFVPFGPLRALAHGEGPFGPFKGPGPWAHGEGPFGSLRALAHGLWGGSFWALQGFWAIGAINVVGPFCPFWPFTGPGPWGGAFWAL